MTIINNLLVNKTKYLLTKKFKQMYGEVKDTNETITAEKKAKKTEFILNTKTSLQ